MSKDRRLSGLYREGACEEPPPHLDAAIRAAARREAGARPRAATGSPFPSGWRLPLAVAAMLVVATTTVTLVMEERGETLRVAEQRAAPAPAAVPPALPPAVPSAAAPAADGMERPAPEAKKQAPAQVADGMPAAPAKLAERSGNFVPEPPAAVSAASEEKAARQSVAGNGTADVREGAAELRRAAPAAPAKEEAAMPPPAATIAQSAAGDARSWSAEGAAGRGAPATAAAGQVAPERDMAREPVRARAETMPPMPAPLAAAKDAQPETPAKWLERIEELRKQGKLEEAAKSLAEFRKRYPDYSLPPHLKDGIRP